MPYNEVLNHWFGPLDAAGMSTPAQRKRWFQSSDQFDQDIRDTFGCTIEHALAGQLDHWQDHPPGLMALVLLLDQFTRNSYRGTAAALAGDSRALELARHAVALGMDRDLPTIHRVFLYVPFEHAEELQAQERGVVLFQALLETAPAPQRDILANYLRYAIAHRDVIARFGRFPHRNALLGRDSSPQELTHLEQHGGF